MRPRRGLRRPGPAGAHPHPAAGRLPGRADRGGHADAAPPGRHRADGARPGLDAHPGHPRRHPERGDRAVRRRRRPLRPTRRWRWPRPPWPPRSRSGCRPSGADGSATASCSTSRSPTTAPAPPSTTRRPRREDDPFAEPKPTASATALRAFAPRGRVLELAAGTGQWTGLLADYADELVVTDASPEMLELNRAKVGERRSVGYRVADAFALEADAAFDVVFFGFFLSHVPPEPLRAFWERRGGAPGARAAASSSSTRPTTGCGRRTGSTATPGSCGGRCSTAACTVPSRSCGSAAELAGAPDDARLDRVGRRSTARSTGGRGAPR